MSNIQMNKSEYESLIKKDIDFMESLPHSLEKDHILRVLADNVNCYYSGPRLMGLEKLHPYKDQYDFNCQLFNGEYNIFIERDNVDLFSVGGFKTVDEAIDCAVKWIKRVNKVPADKNPRQRPTFNIEDLHRTYGK